MLADPVAVFGVLAAVVLASLWLVDRLKAFRALGSALVAILLAMALSNAGVLPAESTTYRWLGDTGVSLAVAFVLLGVDLRSVREAGPTMLLAFAIGAVGTAIGASVAGLAFGAAIGEESWKLAGQYTATYTGGGMNFAAVGRALDTSPDVFTAALAADIIVTAVWLITCLTVPLMLGSRPDGSVEVGEGQPYTLERSLVASERPIRIQDLAGLGLIAGGALWCAQELHAIGARVAGFPELPAILWLTTIVLIVAHVPQVKRLSGQGVIGHYILLLFLATNGAQSVVSKIFEIGPVVFYFALTTVAVHGLILFGVGRLARIDAATLAVASQANVGGPTSAIAIASARGYTRRLLPGVAVGLLGYAAGNYSGLAVAELVHALG